MLQYNLYYIHCLLGEQQLEASSKVCWISQTVVSLCDFPNIGAPYVELP